MVCSIKQLQNSFGASGICLMDTIGQVLTDSAGGHFEEQTQAWSAAYENSKKCAYKTYTYVP